MIETPSKDADAAILGDVEAGPPPPAAQVIGPMTFGCRAQYADVAEFQRGSQRHMIRAGSKKYDWDGSGERHAMRVTSTKRFAEPVHVCYMLAMMNIHRPETREHTRRWFPALRSM